MRNTGLHEDLDNLLIPCFKGPPHGSTSILATDVGCEGILLNPETQFVHLVLGDYAPHEGRLFGILPIIVHLLDLSLDLRILGLPFLGCRRLFWIWIVMSGRRTVTIHGETTSPPIGHQFLLSLFLLLLFVGLVLHGPSLSGIGIIESGKILFLIFCIVIVIVIIGTIHTTPSRVGTILVFSIASIEILQLTKVLLLAENLTQARWILSRTEPTSGNVAFSIVGIGDPCLARFIYLQDLEDANSTVFRTKDLLE
mmetsp:Transcript_6525/g.14841  ORF Transcript_6525/g.14841 Transcript_6525/m.14841 type:complete len:254 (+) Transcript_6525:111-872(+)